jgi:HK97 family phage prohead protease
MSYKPDVVRADAKFQMANGTYPISTCADVKDAAGLAHHSKTYSFAQVKAHVMKAKDALKCPDSILPSTWLNNEQQENAVGDMPSVELRIRGVFPLELRDVGDGMPILHGHFAVFNRWARIDSIVEGQFYESIAPGAFRKTIQENRQRMRVLFNHGKDPQAGMKPLGPIAELREDEEGAYYEVPLLDTSYNRDLLPGLQAGLYGASFQFSVMKERPNRSPGRSDHNPDGWPETVVQEAKVKEFGPVTFPAYQEADAGVRSLTDDFIVMQLVRDPERFQSLVQQYVPTAPALSRPGAEPAHSAAGEPQSSRWPHVSREEFLGKGRSGRTPFDS